MKSNSIGFRYQVFPLVFALVLIINACSDDDEPSNVNDIKITSISPESPASLHHYQTSLVLDYVIIDYDYTITNKDGARIWIQPYTEGEISDGYIYSTSSIFTGKGTRTVLVSIEEYAGEKNVDQLRIIIVNPDGDTLTERFIDVDYTFL